MNITLTLENKQLNPGVINLRQFTSGVDILTFQMDNWMYETHDLSLLDVYAVCDMGEHVDEVKLTKNIVNNKLNIVWKVTGYTTQEDGTLTYQIVFKNIDNDKSILWFSYKAIIFVNSSIDADGYIAASYPTILQQWEERMGSTDIDYQEVLKLATEQAKISKEQAVISTNKATTSTDQAVISKANADIAIEMKELIEELINYNPVEEPLLEMAQARGEFLTLGKRLDTYDTHIKVNKQHVYFSGNIGTGNALVAVVPDLVATDGISLVLKLTEDLNGIITLGLNDGDVLPVYNNQGKAFKAKANAGTYLLLTYDETKPCWYIVGGGGGDLDGNDGIIQMHRQKSGEPETPASLNYGEFFISELGRLYVGDKNSTPVLYTTEQYTRNKETFTATANQTVFNLTKGEYSINKNCIDLFINGISQPQNAFNETNSRTLTLKVGLVAGDIVAIDYQLISSIVNAETPAGSEAKVNALRDELKPQIDAKADITKLQDVDNPLVVQKAKTVESLDGVDTGKIMQYVDASTAGQFDKTTTAPTANNRLNYNGDLYASKVYGAVWSNDYAEYRESNEYVTAGMVVIEDGHGKVKPCNKDFSRLAYIVSDTYGMLIGNHRNALPVALNGRVLAFVIACNVLELGTALTSCKEGCLVPMSEEEEKQYPLSVVGVVAEIPTYDDWHGIKVNGRVWVKLK